MSMGTDDQIKQAIAAIKAGDKNTGSQILHDILKMDRNNLLAWLWMSACVDKKEDKIYCLREVLRIDPDNNNAKMGIAHLTPLPEPIPTLAEMGVEQSQKQPVEKAALLHGPTEKVKRPWYRSSISKLFFFLFLTPIWTLIVLMDPEERKTVKGLALVVALGYLAIWLLMILPLLAGNSYDVNNPEVTYKVWCDNCISASLSYYPTSGDLNDLVSIRTQLPWEVTVNGVNGRKAGVDALVDSGGPIYCSIIINGREVTSDASSREVLCQLIIGSK